MPKCFPIISSFLNNNKLKFYAVAIRRMTSVKVFSLLCPKSELQLHVTLQCGQSFRWREISPGKWQGVIGHKVWSLTQDESHIHYTTYPETSGDETSTNPKQKQKTKRTNKKDVGQEKLEAVLKDYFRLDFSLEKLYDSWKKADLNFRLVCHEFTGVRMLNQDPVENVFSFICSSNNNIKRISMLVERLCQLYGTKIGTLDGITWHSFPTVSSLAADGVEETLRAQGFGYRAKFIHKSAQMIMERGGETWLHSLRSLSYEDCHAQLMTLHGIGAKVSDCICLMSMGHLSAIPVDTHVFQIAARDYLPHLRSCKTVTQKVYCEIGDHFRKVFGEYAGWAHSVLFSADLKRFENLKSQDNHPSKDKHAKRQKTKHSCTK